MSLVGKNIGNYRISSKVGEGGMGAVYLGEHPLIGKRVAVKVLLEELAANADIVNRFFNEAKAVNDIGHPNIVDILDFGKTRVDGMGEIVYFIMEFLEGRSLKDRVRQGLSVPQTTHVIEQCCSALAASHNKGIVHRDLKPDNIYLTTRGSDTHFVKILDFGIAKLTGDSGQNKTRTGIIIGTPAYMSPEQCEGRGNIDRRSDVYSLGVVMYEMLTGRLPFIGTGFGEILVAHLTKTPDRPTMIRPDIPPGLEAVVMTAMEKDPNRRFATMEDFGAALSNPSAAMAMDRTMAGNAATMAGGGYGQAATMMAGGRPHVTTLSGAASEMAGRAPASGGKGALVGALLALLAAGGGVGYWLFLRPQPAPPPAAAAAAAVPAAPATVRVTISSEPPSAKVFRGDTLVGTSPVELVLKKGEPEVQVTVRRDGYVMQTRSLATDTTREILITLAAAPSAAPAAAPKRSGSSGGHRSKPHRDLAVDDQQLLVPSAFKK
jgi:serine/threonine-protein kinase